MSESKTKRERKLRIMTEEAGIDETAREMARQISKMYEDRDRKALGARDHLVAQLHVTCDKYRTANGIMSALDTIRAARDLGFGGVVVCGDLWNRFNIHNETDYRSIINHFEKLRSAIG